MMSNIIQLSKPCTFCDSRENVQLFAGLMLCESCQENVRITNPGMFAVNDDVEHLRYQISSKNKGND